MLNTTSKDSAKKEKICFSLSILQLCTSVQGPYSSFNIKRAILHKLLKHYPSVKGIQ